MNTLRWVQANSLVMVLVALSQVAMGSMTGAILSFSYLLPLTLFLTAVPEALAADYQHALTAHQRRVAALEAHAERERLVMDEALARSQAKLPPPPAPFDHVRNSPFMTVTPSHVYVIDAHGAPIAIRRD